MTRRERPSILYMVPGHDFLPSAGPTRNVLNQVRAMRDWADVTLAFRRVVERPDPSDPTVLEIEPALPHATVVVDDAATRGMSYLGFLSYLSAIRRFLAQRLGSVDLVLEKDWMLTGWVTRECAKRGIPSVPVKNWVAGPPRTTRPDPLKAARHAVAVRAEGWLLRRAPCVVAETEFLRAAIVARWGLDPARIEVIGLGVDRELFRPSDSMAARSRLGISRDATVLLYAGILDRTHDLEPLLRALASLAGAGVQLHVIGDGPRRAEYEALARDAKGSVIFHGRVPHAAVPDYVAAADLCVAPYDVSSFPQGEVGYSTLKVREYLSAGRAVATVPSGSLRELVRDGETGLLVDNDADRWCALLRALPSRERLAEMGVAAAMTDLPTWADVSRAFARLCSRQLATRDGRSAPAADALHCGTRAG